MTTLADRLKWFSDLGYGYLPTDVPEPYGYEYWIKYHEYKKSPIAEKLMKARVELVEKHTPRETVLDIGIGSGHFIEKRAQMVGPLPSQPSTQRLTCGYDVNPHAITWLIARQLWWDPWARDPDVLTFWDSLEHMQRPHDLIARVRSTIFVSLPIFRDREHVLVSKHFKPGEHLWYFTRDGFVRHMKRLGFALAEENQMESDLGREEIGTFVFKRRA
jgi:hypothetical protein